MKTDADYFSDCDEEKLKNFLLKSEVYSLIHDFFKNKQFVFVDPPVLHEQIHGKKQEIYLPLYNNRYSLNYSNALYLAVYAANFERVYSISATFRDEPDVLNHLIEFRMLEVEAQNMDFDEMLGFIESLLLGILRGLLNTKIVLQNSKMKNRILSLISEFPFARVPYYTLLEELNAKYNLNLDDSVDLCSIDYYVSSYMEVPVFIIDYPLKTATWTAKRKDEKTAYAFNLMLPNTYGELSEGCQRNNDAKQIHYKFKCAKITNLDWYASSIAMMNGERSGFGIGIERLLRWIVGADKISDVVYFPRINDSEKK